jgi:hypothetical protein
MSAVRLPIVRFGAGGHTPDTDFEGHAAGAGGRARAGPPPSLPTSIPADVSQSTERRRNHALRRRIDQLLGRVRAAQDEIVERGLSAVHDAPPGDQADPLAPPSAPDPAVVPADAAERRP